MHESAFWHKKHDFQKKMQPNCLHLMHKSFIWHLWTCTIHIVMKELKKEKENVEENLPSSLILAHSYILNEIMTVYSILILFFSNTHFLFLNLYTYDNTPCLFYFTALQNDPSFSKWKEFFKSNEANL